MKKMLCLLTALMFLFSCAAPAMAESEDDGITFGGGITFGMIPEEVEALAPNPVQSGSYGENQNPNVSILTTDVIDMSGYPSTILYLFAGGKLYGVMYDVQDKDSFENIVSIYTNSNGEPSSSSSDGISGWFESTSGSHLDFIGDQYVWTWPHGTELTVARYGTGTVVLWLYSGN